jgi:small subunit ribosomal protein S16
VVVADERSRRNGRYIELVGRYDPRTNPSTIDIDVEKVDEWLSKGAQPTEAASKLIAAARGDKVAPKKESKPSKRAVAKAEAEAAAPPAEEVAAEEADVVAEEVASEEEAAPAEVVEEAPAEVEVVEEAPVEDATEE